MAQEMRSRLEEPSVAAADVVHDLGNLIQIASSAIMLISRSPDMPSRRRGPMLAQAQVSLDRAGELVRQTLGTMREGSRPVREVSVAACLFDIKALVDTMWRPPFQLEVWIDVDLPKVRCDPLGLQNAVLNLVFNAREAMADSGTVSMRARALDEGPDRGLELSVADTGVGMSPETIARAFEPFFTTKSDGTGGVGLPMVERFVREAGGAISVESRLDIGTTVTVRLPAAASQEQDP